MSDAAPLAGPTTPPRARPARQAAPSESPPAGTALDPRLARLPTEEEIAAEVRRRPIGAVVVDICCDLGIAPGNLDRAFWDEIFDAVVMYGGNLCRLVTDLGKRMSVWWHDSQFDPAALGWPTPPRSPAPATGPPRA
jgi:hypothetical protein